MISNRPMKITRAINYWGPRIVVEDEDMAGAALFTGGRSKKRGSSSWKQAAGPVDVHFKRHDTPKYPFGGPSGAR